MRVIVISKRSRRVDAEHTVSFRKELVTGGKLLRRSDFSGLCAHSLMANMYSLILISLYTGMEIGACLNEHGLCVPIGSPLPLRWYSPTQLSLLRALASSIARKAPLRIRSSSAPRPLTCISRRVSSFIVSSRHVRHMPADSNQIVHMPIVLGYCGDVFGKEKFLNSKEISIRWTVTRMW